MDDSEKIQKFYQAMQKYFMKKDQNYKGLKFLVSRATTESSNNIDELLQRVSEIFDKFIHETATNKNEENDQVKYTSYTDRKYQLRISQSYNCLLLNTNFSVQLRLAEDITHGHLVGMWPVLSPYLFIQIVWKLCFEDLLMESIRYVPLELCLEILEITSIHVMELEFKRALHILENLILFTYKRCFLLNTLGTQTNNIEKYEKQLEATFNILLDQLTSPKMIQSESDSDSMVNYERQGIILKHIITLIKKCTEMRLTSDHSTGEHSSNQKSYTLTFGNDKYHYLTIESLKSIVATFDHELATLLLNQIKKVDCHMYIAWADLDDQDGTFVTLQRAIAVECCYFIQFMKNDDILSQNEQLIECLQQLAGSNQKPTLIEVHNCIEKGQPGAMTELIQRYREWDETTLHFVYDQRSLLSIDDCQLLLEYLVHQFSMESCTNAMKDHILRTVITIIKCRDVTDVCDITFNHMLRYFNSHVLDPFTKSINFDAFIRSNPNLRDSSYFKDLLLLLTFNPREVLTIFISAAIGCDEYKNTAISPHDVLQLRPLLCAQQSANCTYLTSVLRDVCIRYERWHPKKFTHFVHVMLDAKITNPDDLINNVFIPYFAERTFNEYNINCMLINIRKLICNCTFKVNAIVLCTTLVRKMSEWRKCQSKIPRTMVNEVLANITRILGDCIHQRMTAHERRVLMDAVKTHGEPLDKAQLSPMSYVLKNNILDVICDYEKRYYDVYRLLKLGCPSMSYMHNYMFMIKLEREDFIRHMFLHATAAEYRKYAYDLAILSWHFFGWVNEMNACDNVLRITVEAARLALEYTHDMPRDSFIELLKNMKHFCSCITATCSNADQKTLAEILAKNLTILSTSTQVTQYSSLYDTFLEKVTAIADDTLSDNNLEDILELVDGFINDGLKLLNAEGMANESNFLPNDDIMDKYEAYKFVCACMMVPSTKKRHRCIEKIEQLIINNSDDS